MYPVCGLKAIGVMRMPQAGVSRFGTSIVAGEKKQPTLKPEGIGFLFHVSQSSSIRSAPAG